MRLARNVIVSSVLILALVTVSVTAAEFSLNQAAGTDTVYFRSTAKLEFIEGKTTSLSGGFRLDPANTNGPITGRLQVDLRTLKTGIDTRDSHMRNNHLQTDKFPYAYFELTGVTGLPPKLSSDTSYSVEAEGLFYIHGLKRKLKATAEVVWYQVDSDGYELDFRCTFQLRLDDYQIDRPKALFLKLAETIEIDVVATGSTKMPASDIEFPDWELVP